ncbi:MAG: PDZ domain-containing protein [Planctomycetes bacterium]|nr:PDZ domain-containing protein [Planctomycetota bacterium]
MRSALFVVVAVSSFAAALPAQRPDRARRAEPDGPPPVTALDPRFAEQLAWRELGPSNMGGRIVDIDVVASDPSTFWVATASGGLLKTTNNGISFEHQFDREAVVSVGAMAVAPSDPNVVWVGTGENNPRNSVSYGDGVYRSLDGGKTWTNMGLRDTFQIGDVVIDPRDPNVVWVGALGRLYGANAERGLYVTRDGGATWERPLFVDERSGVIDIAMHPDDPDTLLVATWERARDGFDGNDPATKWGPGSGIWRTQDGGRTFERVRDGLPSSVLGRVGFDWYAKDPDVVFAIVECEAMGKVDPEVGWSGAETSNAEAGARLTAVASDSPAERAGLLVGDIVVAVNGTAIVNDRAFREAIAGHRAGAELEIEIARNGARKALGLTLGERRSPTRALRGNAGGTAEGGAESNAESGAESTEGQGARPRLEVADRPYGERLGGQVANVHRMQGRDGHEFGGLYRSDDAGRTWRRINSIDPRPMYFSQVRVDPNDDRRLWVLGIAMSRSQDGGETFTADAGRGVHADQHALWIDPRDGRHLIVGCDGGVYHSYDRGETWDHLNHAALGQFYDVALDPRRGGWVFGGLQDNGTWGAPTRIDRDSGPTNGDWVRIGSGDGFEVAVDPEDPQLVYYESQNGATARTHLLTMAGGPIRAQAGRDVRHRYNWKTPFLLSQHNSRIYYSAGNHVFRSLDRGNGLTAISPEITRTRRGSGTALAESPRDASVLYVGSDDGALFGTRDGGHTWSDLWPLAADAAVGTAEAAASRGHVPLRELVPAPRWVSSIEASRFADGRAYVTLDAHRSDDDEPYVLATEDFGQTWRSLRANLPRGSTRCVREDLRNENLLYVGTEFGFWVSIDRGQSWTRMHGNGASGGLPTVAVHDLAQHPSSGEIVLATHGRSLWSFDASCLRQFGAAATASTQLFTPNDVVVWRSRHRRGSNGTRQFTGDNPRAEAEFWYRLGADAERATLIVQTLDGKDLARIEAKATAGLHRSTWDLRASAAPAGDGARGAGAGSGAARRGGARGGRSATPGSYRLVLDVDGVLSEQRFVVLADPELGAAQAAGGNDEEDGEDEDRGDRDG